MVTVEPSKTLTLLWGATGEQEWTPALTTGKNLRNNHNRFLNEKLIELTEYAFFFQLFTILTCLAKNKTNLKQIFLKKYFFCGIQNRTVLKHNERFTKKCNKILINILPNWII